MSSKIVHPPVPEFNKWEKVTPAADLEEVFRTSSAEWRSAVAHLSSTTRRVQHPAYQRIIASGQNVVPLLLRELKERPNHWIAASVCSRVLIRSHHRTAARSTEWPRRGSAGARNAGISEWGPALRISSDALHCGQRHDLHDDFRAVRLPKSLIAAPPLELWPRQVVWLPLPEDLKRALTTFPQEKAHP